MTTRMPQCGGGWEVWRHVTAPRTGMLFRGFTCRLQHCPWKQERGSPVTCQTAQRALRLLYTHSRVMISGGLRAVKHRPVLSVELLYWRHQIMVKYSEDWSNKKKNHCLVWKRETRLDSAEEFRFKPPASGLKKKSRILSFWQMLLLFWIFKVRIVLLSLSINVQKMNAFVILWNSCGIISRLQSWKWRVSSWCVFIVCFWYKSVCYLNDKRLIKTLTWSFLLRFLYKRVHIK